VKLADIVISVNYRRSPFGFVAQLLEDYALYNLRTLKFESLNAEVAWCGSHFFDRSAPEPYWLVYMARYPSKWLITNTACKLTRSNAQYRLQYLLPKYIKPSQMQVIKIKKKTLTSDVQVVAN
jgi:hypothetical protein